MCVNIFPPNKKTKNSKLGGGFMFISIPPWGNDPIWLYHRVGSTTNVLPPTLQREITSHAAFCSSRWQAENFLLSDKSPTSVVAWLEPGGLYPSGVKVLNFPRNQPEVTMKKMGGFDGRCKFCFQGWGVLFCRIFRVEYVKLQVVVGDLKRRFQFYRFYGLFDQLRGRTFSWSKKVKKKTSNAQRALLTMLSFASCFKQEPTNHQVTIGCFI